MSDKQDEQDQGLIFVPYELIEKIKGFPFSRTVEHCDLKFDVSPLDIYAVCPHCNAKIKMRAFSGNAELEDAFDAFAEWLMQPGGLTIIEKRYEEIKADSDQ